MSDLKGLLALLRQRGATVSDTDELILSISGVRDPEGLLALALAFPSLGRNHGFNTASMTLALEEESARLRALGVASGPGWKPRRFATGATAPTGAPAAPGTTIAPTLSPAAFLAQASNIWSGGRPPRHTWRIRNQGDRGTCVAHAAVAQLEVNRPDRYSPQYLYWAIKMHHDPDPTTDGTSLAYAEDALKNQGVCLEHQWRYDGRFYPKDVPHDRRRPKTLPPGHVFPAQHRRSGGAQAVLNALRTGGAVAITLPVVSDPLDPRRTNWTTLVGELYGQVLDPPPWMVSTGCGHAVCAVGFIADPAEPTGGYFIIRNSWGTGWGQRLPAPGQYAPAPGYGTVSATHVDRYLWETLVV